MTAARPGAIEALRNLRDDPKLADLTEHLRTSGREALAALQKDRALANLEDLLTKDDTKFNLLRALELWDVEDTHSRILRWLFDAKGSHGLKSGFLKSFAENIRCLRPFADHLVGARAEREYGTEGQRLDLLVVNDKTRIAVAIENKWFAGTHGDQLKIYRDFIKYKFGHFPEKYYLYLTRHGTAPKGSSGWTPVSYRAVLASLEAVFEVEQAIDPCVLQFLRQYAAFLRKSLMIDPKILRLVRELYVRHPQAFGLMKDVKMNYVRAISEALGAAVARRVDHVGDVALRQEDRTTWWVPFRLSAWVGRKCLEIGKGDGIRSGILLVQFEVDKVEAALRTPQAERPRQHLAAWLTVTPCPEGNAKLREKVIAHIRDLLGGRGPDIFPRTGKKPDHERWSSWPFEIDVSDAQLPLSADDPEFASIADELVRDIVERITGLAGADCEESK